ncbi:MAG TPA: hypothetical protein VM364_11355 [Vicinamibacterales bacterium]|nr:hypothetical protein [Vicinamibacterales bacterium]
MAEVFVTYGDHVTGPDGRTYAVRACGAEMEDGRWQGWLEFDPLDGGAPLRSARETTQPNRTDTAYWATGLTPVYLEGSLERTLKPAPAAAHQPSSAPPAFDGPAPAAGEAGPRPAESVLNPFSVYRKGEELLRQQLGALASWHLVNIIRAYRLSDQPPAALERATSDELIELIIAAVRQTAARPA